eukprot:NODE_9434_length_642_cov_103.030829_g9168_i0.p1 GENE.NODE_9434_length_642_cov_103.030829_g9168_i0~~NODE_9434_length_642_cov_103.030829_g9168_i0.p1  ORF type:complete len:100 (+),score=10.01 NODE_9434_length_642_cov_103.030829_g9168_i0:130-429(+)
MGVAPARTSVPKADPHPTGIDHIVDAQMGRLITASRETIKLWSNPKVIHTIHFQAPHLPVRKVVWDGFSMVALAGSTMQIYDFSAEIHTPSTRRKSSVR